MQVSPANGLGAAEPSQKRIPVLRPKLPAAENLLPYLQRIDQSRIYSNQGPLSCELQQRLARMLDLPPAGVVLTSSGT